MGFRNLALDTHVLYTYILFMKRINIFITDYQVKEIAKITKKLEWNLSSVIRNALDEYIEKIKKKHKIR